MRCGFATWIIFLTLAEQAEGQRRSGDETAYFNFLKTDYENVRLALEWSLEQGHTRDEAGWRLAAALRHVLVCAR